MKRTIRLVIALTAIIAAVVVSFVLWTRDQRTAVAADAVLGILIVTSVLRIGLNRLK